jgi:predicted Rossmann-fold nucleotide-binding protein
MNRICVYCGSSQGGDSAYRRAARQLGTALVRANLELVYGVGGPASETEWRGAVKVVEAYLGLGRTRMDRYIHKVFVDAAPLVTLTGDGR